MRFSQAAGQWLGAIGYMLNCDRRPSLLVVTDIDEARLERAEQIFSAEYAKERGVEIHYVNTAKVENDVETLRALTGGTGLMMYLFMRRYRQSLRQLTRFWGLTDA